MQRYAGILLLTAVMALAGVYAMRVTPPDGPAGLEASGNPQAARKPEAAALPAGTGFDFYVLSLSWSPTFCLSDAGSGNRQQCGDGTGYGLIVHGLWPQNERGYPEFCPSSEPERVPNQLGRQMFDIMPGIGLIGHQWRKHGTCSGLSQADYFTLTRKAFERITIPEPLRNVAEPAKIPVDEIERLFSTANADLTPQGVAVTCDKDKFDEVRICLSKQLNFRPCDEVDRQSCRLPSIAVPAMR